MSFAGFSQSDFDTFSIDGLDQRMEAIQSRIQPKFKQIGEGITEDLATIIGSEMYLHIAKHARRSVNPPKDTWLAIANNKRGYKQHPHFQVGLFDDHVFIWLAFIYELPGKTEIAKKFIKNRKFLKETVPAEYVISVDHMQKASYNVDKLSDKEFKKVLERFKDVKKAELLIGRQINSGDPVLKDGDAFMAFVKDTFKTLVPIYKLAYK